MTVRQDHLIRQGETWSWTYTYVDANGDPVDLTGYSARMGVRRVYGGSLEAYLSTGSDADGGTLTLGDEAGTVALAMTAVQTTALIDSLSLSSVLLRPDAEEQPEEAFRYDLEIVSGGGVVTRILEGRIVVRREITE